MVAILGVASLVFSTRHLPGGEERSYYFPLFHFLALGVTGAFLTGDLFNLFVWFEVMLMASYVFVAYSGGPQHTRAAFWYVSLNLLASAIFLLGVGGIYATTGTLNMADLAQRLAEPAAYGLEPVPVVGLLGLLLSVFAIKAGLVPFQFWIPTAYRAAPPQIRSPRCWPARPKGRDLRHHPPLLYRVRRRGGRRQPPAPTGGRLHCGRLAAAVRRRGPVPHGQREHPPRRHRSRGP